MATLDTMERTLKALADRTRLRILHLLGGDEVCVCHIHESLRLPQPTVSRHLAYLRRAGLVETRKDGLWVHYRRVAPADPVLATVIGAVTHCTRHVAQTARDARRLERIVGCCADVPEAPRGLACCGSEASAPVLRAGAEQSIMGVLRRDGRPHDDQP